MTFHACSLPAPTLVKPQPAPAILSQESVHTALSITHHTRKRPSTGPRTTHGPQARQLLGGETCTDPQGGYPSGCRLIDGGSGPKSVGGSSQMELGNPGETRETRRFILVRASGE
jgi:hypothetical protein